MTEQKKVQGYNDPNDPGNGIQYRTGKKCLNEGCNNEAGTAWSPYLCFECNVKRIDRIDASFDKMLNKKETRSG